MLPRVAGCDPHSFPQACTLLFILSLCRQLKTVACPGTGAQMHSLGAPQITRHAKKREKRKENVVIPVLIVQILQRPFQCRYQRLQDTQGPSLAVPALRWVCGSPQGHGLTSEQGLHLAQQTSKNPAVQFGRGSGRLLSAHRAYELTDMTRAGALWLLRAPRDASKACLSHLWDCLAIQPSALP